NFSYVLKAWLPLLAIITAFCALAYAAVQQVFRQSANDPQIQMAEDAAAALERGADVNSVLPAGHVDLEESIAPFVMVFDADGNVAATSVTLNGKTPQLPAGVLESAKQLHEDRVTWQPNDQVRVASVIVAYSNGYVLAGRSLRDAEEREMQLRRFVYITWIAAVLVTFVLVAAGEWFAPGRSQ